MCAIAVALVGLFAAAGVRAGTPAWHSNVVYVIDQATGEVLTAKNETVAAPIASITKLMTALVVEESVQSLSEIITITNDDVDRLKFSSSRLPVGTKLSREQALHLALMSSENRAAHALGRSYTGGLPMFVLAMNAKAASLGMTQSVFTDPTGLSSDNRSTGRDLAALVNAAHANPLLQSLSISQSYDIGAGKTALRFGTTNGLVANKDWNIQLQKTGFINEAGRCMVMQMRVAGRALIAVFLNAPNTYSRVADAMHVRTLFSNKTQVAKVVRTPS